MSCFFGPRFRNPESIPIFPLCAIRFRTLVTVIPLEGVCTIEQTAIIPLKEGHTMSHIGIETVIGLGKVVRFHACGAPGSQTVADHSAKVALYAQILARHMGLELSDRDRADCYELALLHDAHETVFGDTPYPAKQMMQQAGIDMDALAMAAFWNTKGLPDAGMSQRAVDLVNLADHLEAALHAREYYPVKAFDTRVQVLALAAKLGPLYVGAIRAALWRPEPDEEASA